MERPIELAQPRLLQRTSKLRFLAAEQHPRLADYLGKERTMATVDASGEVDSKTKYDTAVSSGQSALRALLTMNGGATVAFLAFIGHIMEAGSMPVESGKLFVGAMQLFIFGTFLAVLPYGTIFLTNCLSRINWKRTSDWMFGISILFGFASLGCFLIASLQAIEGFRVANEILLAKPK